MKSTEVKLQIIAAAEKAVQHLIKVAKEDIIKPDPEDDLAADRLKNAAATKKLCIFDAFDSLTIVLYLSVNLCGNVTSAAHCVQWATIEH